MMKRLMTCLLCLTMLLSSGAADAETNGNAIRVESLVNGILNFHLSRTGAEDLQAWIDGELAQTAGMGAEWNIFALSQRGGYDFSSYCSALLKSAEEAGMLSAATRQKYAVVLLSAGGENDFVRAAMQETIGTQGIMTWVYGLHLLNAGLEGSVTAQQAVEAILALQFADGGWALRGDVSDVDVTAMTLQALAPHAAQAGESIERAVEVLAERQLETGDFVTFGAPNPESAAQVVIALAALGIDAFEDERFIKDGATLLDVIEKYQLPDGSFCHEEGGAYNANATMQTLQALIAWQRLQDGRGSLYSIPLVQAPAMKTELSAKTVIALAIAGLALLISLVLFLMGKRHIKNFLAVWVLAAAVCGFVVFTDFQSAENYYSGQSVVKKDPVGQVAMSIHCDNALGKTSLELPGDGVMLAPSAFAIAQGDTAYTILTEAAQTYGIRLDTSGPQGMIYVVGVNHLYEFACGELSGWTYLVNGERSGIGCDQYLLKDGDVIEWRYTCELGNDLN